MSKIYDYDEISKHNTAEDLWMVIDGKVYDCTAFLDEHPGGEEVMVDCGGIDATGPFDDIGHSEDAREALEPLYIGDVDPESAAIAAANGTSGSAGVTGGEQNAGLIIAIIMIVVAVLAYFLFLK